MPIGESKLSRDGSILSTAFWSRATSRGKNGDKYEIGSRTQSSYVRINGPILEEEDDERNPNNNESMLQDLERSQQSPCDDLNLAANSTDEEQNSVISSTSAVMVISGEDEEVMEEDDGDDDNEEHSVISGTSAVISLSRPQSNVQQRNESFRNNQSVPSDAITLSRQTTPTRNSSFSSKQAVPSAPIAISRQPTPALQQQRNTSFRSNQSEPSAPVPISRQPTPALQQQRNTSVRSNQSISQPIIPAGRLPSKPNTSQSNRLFKGDKLSKMLSKDSFSTYDSQELYALSRSDVSYTTSKEKEYISKAQSLRASSTMKKNAMDFSCGSSVDSQEMYAMMMTFNTANTTEELDFKQATEMKRLAMEKKLAAEYAEAEVEKPNARWAEKEAAKRKSILAAKEAKKAEENQSKARWGLLRRAETAERETEIAREEELKAEAEAELELKRNAEREAIAAAEAQLQEKLQKLREYEMKQRELEEEVERAHRKKLTNVNKLAEKSPYVKPFNWASGGAKTNAKILQQFSDDDSDYSSDSNGGRQTEFGENETNFVDGDTKRTGVTGYTGRTSRHSNNDEESEGYYEDEETAILGDLNVITRTEDERTIKSNVSSISGSDDEEGEDGEVKTSIPIVDEAEEESNPSKQKKKVVMASKGLGKQKTKEITNKPVLFASKAKKMKRATLTKTTKNIKNTLKKANKPAPKKKRKVVSSQMITIRQKGRQGVDDIVPTKTDANAKVMRVCKLTSKGYISAEFTSVDPRNTPLHIACLTHYPEKFILDHLMKTNKKNEDYIFTENSSGELPIHYAVMDRQGVPPKILEKLLEEFPESVEHPNMDGSLPIHVACEVGAPHLYVIKRLIEAWPGSVMIQNDLQVPLHEDDEEAELEKQMESRGILSCFYDNFGVDWFGGNELMEIEDYETNWTPLHLASLNGAEPDVIELLLNTNPMCMELQTNKGRTALDCAKWCVINAIINDVSVSKLQNTFTSIQIMQSYDHELRVKEELVLKTGLVKAALENSDVYGQLWERAVELLPGHQTELEKRAAAEAINENEVGLTNLHRVILSKSPPEEVQSILEENPDILDITTTHNRTPMECAKHIIIKGLLLDHLVSDLTNTFVSLEVMQAFEEQRDTNHELDASEALSKSVANRFKEIGVPKFGSKMDNYNYTKKFVEMIDSDLGNFVTADNDSAIQPHEYYPPANLNHVNLRITIPVGFRRFRRAFLNVKEHFLPETVLEKGMGYSDVNILPWNKQRKAIGMPKLKKGEKWKDFIGAIRTLQYWVPRSEAGGSHMAYETMEIIDYNDFCFAVKSIVKAPDLPYGSEYETHHQLIVHDKGVNSLRMICSSEVKFTGMNLDDEWEVRNSMRHQTTAYFYALADAMCLHAG